MTIPIAESGITVTVPLQAWADAPLNETLEMSLTQQSERRTLMRRIRRNILELLMLALLVVTTAVSVGQLTAQAQDPPACLGLPCDAQNPCGSKCFCNGGFCRAD
jgi:hypothetical protein